jgi:molybdopterin-guanine dinucleotide biosynthesis protein B
MIPVVSFIGHRGSGKTRLLAQLIPVFIDRGYRVGAVKHAPSLEQLDATASDSATHLDAGANRVLLRGAVRSALFWNHEGALDARDIERLFPECDLVLVEGLKGGPFPKIEVFRERRDGVREPLAGGIDVVAVVTQDRIGVPDAVTVLPPSRPEEIADFIEEHVLGISA